jgi:hypothetical protein
MGSGFLDVAERDPGVKGGCDERMPQRVRPDGLGDPDPAGHPADDPPSSVPVQPTAVGGHENRSLTALTDGQIDRPGGTWC